MKQRACLLLMFIFLVSAPLLRAEPGKSQDRLTKVLQTGQLRVCIWPDYYGISYRNPKTQQLVGIDIDLARELARDLGPEVRVEFVDSSFARLIEDVTADRCDIAMFAIGMTPARAEKLRFTQPHLQSDIITEPFAYATASQRFATVFYTFGVYLKLLVFPHPLTIDYYPFHIKLANWNSPIVWVSLLTYVALGAYAALNLRRRSVVAYGIAFYLLSFSIVSNLPFSVGTFMSERFLFIPSLGFVIALAWFLSTKVFQVIQHEKLILATISLVCLTKTYHRNGQWKNDFTLFTADVGTSSNSIKGNLAASVSYLEESQRVGDSELATRYRSSALEHSKKAISLYESFVDAQHLRGTSYDHALTLLCDCYSVNGLLEDALSCYKQALRIVSNRVQLCATIETTIDKSPDLDFKLRSYTEFADLVPDNFLFAYRLGYLYGKEKNDLARSIQYLQRAVRIDPKETHALEALSHAYKLSKDYEKAAFYLEKATAESPNSLSHLTRLLAIYKLARNREKQSEIELRIGELQQ